MDTRSGDKVSAQIGKMGTISGIENADFSLGDGQSFNIKNENTQPIELSVQLVGMADGEFVTTKFVFGWNPEIIKKVKQTSLSSYSLKWGY